MLISVHDYQNQFYPNAAPTGQSTGTGWDLGFTSQQLVTASIVTKTGGTYELTEPVEESKSKKASKTKK